MSVRGESKCPISSSNYQETRMQTVRWKGTSLVMDPRMWLTLFICVILYLIKEYHLKSKWKSELDNFTSTIRYEFQITRTWDNRAIDHSPVNISLVSYTDLGVKILVKAPFFNDPPSPGGTPGQPFSGLWDYEVVEMFFLGEKNHYLEVELCPHGQHLVLLLKGYRKPLKDMLPLEFKSTIVGVLWQGEAIIPSSYFPKQVTRMNAYAIHGSDDKRVYEALYPTPSGKYELPDFHRLDYFRDIDFISLLPSNVGERYESSLWPSP